MHRGVRSRSVVACALHFSRPRRTPRSGSTNLSATPADTNAGANSDFSIALTRRTRSDLKDLTIHLPPGLVGNPLATTTLHRGSSSTPTHCPRPSDVGDVTNNVTLTVARLPVPSRR